MLSMEIDTLDSIAEKNYTIDDAAKVLQRSRRQVFNIAREKGWRGTMFKNVRFFNRDDVEETKRELVY